MSDVELQIEIYRDNAVPSGGPHPQLFTRTLDMGHTPAKGDLIFIARSDEEAEGTLGTYVEARFWTYTGTLILVLRPYHIDPSGLAIDFVDGQNRAYWNSANGDLCADLIASGFEETR